MTGPGTRSASGSVLFDDRTGWAGVRVDDIGTLGGRGLHLAGARGVTHAVTGLPEWLAAPAWAGDGGLPPVLLGDDGTVRRWDPVTGTFALLVSPTDLGAGPGDLTAVAVSAADLYLLDPAHSRILVCSARGDLRAVLDTHPARPVAVCGTPGGAAVLLGPDAGTGADRAVELCRHRTGELRLDPPVRLPDGTWTRCLAGREGRVWIVDEAGSSAVELDDADGVLRRTDDGPGLARETAPPDVELRPEGIRHLGAPGSVDRNGRAVARSTDLVAPSLPRSGRWISDALDSGLHRCQWHRLSVRAELPARTSIRLSSHTADAPRPPAEIAALPADRWRATGAVDAGDTDVLVLSGPGRYLWVRAELSGDGYDSPAMAALRVEYPRRSYLRFLPAVYSADARSADFLSRYLAIPGTVLEHWDTLLRELPRLVDPRSTPDRFVAVLASWLDVPVEGTWTPQQQRRLVEAAAGYLRRRGTPAAIRDHVAAYLAAGSGTDPDPDGLPQIVEGFTQRQIPTLPVTGDRGTPLWSPGRVARLQTDRFDRLGEVRLVSGGDPRLDVYAEYAHRFAVLVPADRAATPAARAMLRRAVAQESPAHVRADLVPVHPAMCLGVQSQLGRDTALAAPAPVRLFCRAEAIRLARDGEDPAVPRLGPLAVLGPAPGPARIGGPAPDGSMLAVS